MLWDIHISCLKDSAFHLRSNQGIAPVSYTHLGDEENGFEYVKSLAAETGVRVPAGLKDLEKKPVRHKGVIEIAQMQQAVENSVK